MIFNSKIFSALLSVLSVWILFSVISVEVEKNQVKNEEAALEAKIVGMKQDNELLQKDIERFKNPEFLEKEARLRLNYKAPGEEVVFVYRDLNAKKASSAENFSLENMPNYEKWWHWLLGY